ncbi:MAG: Hpt domain-containing protein [Candidatus Riflebacteria bacterium]|nr:Hpt domain-containing protein [Candidatus Riflebacteria bacterium]
MEIGKDQDLLYALTVFIAENLDLLDSVEQRLISLEKMSPDSEETKQFLNDIFRLFHSLKGGAASFDLNIIRDVTHQMENLLDYFRQHHIKVEPTHVDLMNQTCDFIKKSMVHVSKHYSDDVFLDESVVLIENTKIAVRNLEEKYSLTPRLKVEFKKVPGKIADDYVTGVINTSHFSKTQPLSEMKIIVTPEIKVQFAEESEKLLEEILVAMARLEGDQANQTNYDKECSLAFSSLRSFSSMSEFFGYREFSEFSRKLMIICDAVLNRRTDEIVSSCDLVISGTRELLNNLQKFRFFGDIEITIDASLRESIEALSNNFSPQVKITSKQESRNIVKQTSDNVKVFANLDDMKLELTPEMLQEFVNQSEEIFGNIKNGLQLIEKNPASIEKIERTIRDFHLYTGLAEFFGFPNLANSSKLCEVALFHLIKNPIKDSSAPLHAISSSLDDLINTTKAIVSSGGVDKDAPTSSKAEINTVLTDFQHKTEIRKLLLPTVTHEELFVSTDIEVFRSASSARINSLIEYAGSLEANPESVHLLENIAMEVQLLNDFVSSLLVSAKKQLPSRHPLQVLRILTQAVELFAGRIFNEETFGVSQSSVETLDQSVKEMQNLVDAFFLKKISVDFNRKLFSTLSINFMFFRESDIAFLDSLIKKFESVEYQTTENINEYIQGIENISLACQRLGREDLLNYAAFQKKLLNDFLQNPKSSFQTVFSELKKSFGEMLEKVAVIQKNPEIVCSVASSSPAAPTAFVQPELKTPSVASSTHPASAASTGSSVKGTLRVDEDKIDKLLTIIGEMFVTCESFGSLEKQLIYAPTLDFISQKMKEIGINLSKLTSDLEKGMMEVRLVPLRTFFQRLPRIVRDLSRQLGKNVRFEVRGEDCEVDKKTLEKITDPLLHILRNSVDHGIEMPEIRTQNGKDPEGVVSLNARIANDTIYFEIIDDGKGLNADVLKNKAIEKGILTPEKASQMTENEAFEIIFLPGFSTAEKVTDVSGRGVGMDVVKTNIQQLQGKVFIYSKLTKGSTFRIELPVQKLCLMIFHTLLVKSGEGLYLVPMDNVSNLSHIAKHDIHNYSDLRFANIFGKLYPMMFLEELLENINVSEVLSGLDNKKDISVVLLKTSCGELALAVDKFVSEERVVVKPLNIKFACTPLISGTAILGDGNIALVIEPEKLAGIFSSRFGDTNIPENIRLS